MVNNNHGSSGITGSVGRLTNSVLGLAQTRFELFSVELQEEKLRLVQAFVFVAAAALFGFMALATATVLLLVLFWTQAKIAVLASLIVVYWAAATWCWKTLRKQLSQSSKPFSASISELEKDRECLAMN